ncbi:MAG: DUF4136 domain-containing protein [Calditrichales bacterium]|nr:MAG: DUF4136 domain-containing protein [Calditrichales bacterium]
MFKLNRKAIIIAVAFTVSVFLVWGCSSFSYKTDFDPSIEFSTYKTYIWYPGKMPDGDALSANPLVKKRVIAGIDKALQAKGYTLGTEDSFDFAVIIHAGQKEKTQIVNYGNYGYGGYGYGRYGSGWGGYGGYNQTDVYQYDETTLVIDIADGAKKEMVWRGTVTGVVKENVNQEEQQKNIDAVVEKMLDNFPPGN